MNRRSFMLGSSAAMAATVAPTLTSAMAQAATSVRGRSPAAVARDEDFWLPIQQAYNVEPRYIMLNAGGSNPCPRNVHETRQRLHDLVNASPNINSNQ